MKSRNSKRFFTLTISHLAVLAIVCIIVLKENDVFLAHLSKGTGKQMQGAIIETSLLSQNCKLGEGDKKMRFVEECIFRAPEENQKIDIVLVGDSFAQLFESSFVEYSKANSLNIAISSMGGCRLRGTDIAGNTSNFIFLDKIFVSDYHKNCEERNSFIFRYLIESGPKNIVILNNYSSDLETNLEFNSFLHLLDRNISMQSQVQLVSRVLVVENWPIFRDKLMGVEKPLIELRRYREQMPLKYFENQRILLEKTRSIRLKATIYLATYPLFCSNYSCTRGNRNTSYYKDGAHLGDVGVQLVWSAVKKYMQNF